MKKHITILFFALTLIYTLSCRQNEKQAISRTSVIPTTLSSDLMTNLPGELYASDNYIFWMEAFPIDYYIHILNKSGEELGQMLRRGNGPDEMIIPEICMAKDSLIVAMDVNMDKVIYLSIDSVLHDRNPVINRAHTDYPITATRHLVLDEHDELIFDPSSNSPFQIIETQTGQTYHFGTLPLEETVDNAFDYYQGTVAYNPSKNILYTLHSECHICAFIKK